MEMERETLWNEVDLEASMRTAEAVDLTDGSLLKEYAMEKVDTPQSSGAEDDEDDVKEDHGYSGLHRLCFLPRNGPLDPRWDGVRRHLSQLPSDENDRERMLTSTQKKGYDFTPLHVVCFLSPPVDVVQQLIDLCPASVKMTTAFGDTPLGLACGGFVPAGGDVIKQLVHVYSQARNEVNLRNQTPLHIHLRTAMSYEMDPSPLVVKLLTTVDAVNVRDVNGHTVLYQMGKAASKAFSPMAKCIRFFQTPNPDEDPDMSNYKKCLDTILNNEPQRDSRTLFLRDLLQLPQSLRAISFDMEVTKKTINDIMGRGPYIALLMSDFYVQMMIVIAYTIGCSYGFENNSSCITIMMVGAAYWIFRRGSSLMGARDKMAHALNSVSFLNASHIAVLIVSSFYLRENGIDLAEEGGEGPRRNLLLVTSALIWLMLMGITCHASKGFSVFVHGSIQIFKQLSNLLVVFGLIFMSFSTMFYVSSVDSPGFCTVDPNDCSTFNEEGECEAPGAFCTLDASMTKVSTLFFGTLEATDFDVPQPVLALMFFFNTLVMLLFLNIIIAMMSDSYAEVNERAESVFWDHRFELIHDVDAFTNCFTSFKCCRKNKAQQEVAKERKAKVSWFITLIHSRRDTTSNLAMLWLDVVTGAAMGLWVVAGLCTLGLTWPRAVRRKLFAPSTANDDKDDKLDTKEELEALKEETLLLTSETAKLREENQILKKLVEELRKGESLDLSEANLGCVRHATFKLYS